MNEYSIFQNGSVWLRTDFHLHTKADKEFSWNGNDNSFIDSYVQKLKDANIRVGVIANHNKFDRDEFKALRKKAISEEIFLLPGIELSIKDGANGIHTLVVFAEDWIDNKENQDYINTFLSVAFAGQANYDTSNARSNHDLLETIRELDKFDRDYFFVFAHVEQKSGLWKELGGGRIKELGENDLFRKRCHAFQKVRTNDEREKVKQWLGNWYPAEVEGSDCKSVDDIGKGENSYLKIGYYAFEAVKYALLDNINRLSKEPKKYKHSHINSISFEGGILAGHTICLSPELNTFIGIRGSGKSSVLEAIRYVLNIPFGEKEPDQPYKRGLVDHSLGSGGKVVIKAVDQRGQEYVISRILKDQPDVYVNGKLYQGISIRETILHKPVYFGQKDLSTTGEGFEKDLVEKLLGERLQGIRSRIEDQKQKVRYAVEQLIKISDVDEKKKEYEAKKKDAEYRLGFFKRHNVEEKLQKQIDFDADSRKCSQVNDVITKYLSDLEQFVLQYQGELQNQLAYQSKQNESFFKEYLKTVKSITDGLQSIIQVLNAGKLSLKELQQKRADFEKVKDGLKEEFAQIERKLAEELKNTGASSIMPNEFRQLTAVVAQATQMLDSLAKLESQRTQLSQSLLNELDVLGKLWLEEYQAIKKELEKVNQNHSALLIDVEYREDKEKFMAFMKDMFRGSKLREATFQYVTENYADFCAVYKDLTNALNGMGNSSVIFQEYFQKNLPILLTWQVPNRFVIKYQGKELRRHSLGQRASALILFVLSQRDNDVIIIDQPEDDLDNQTIYEDVIKLIRNLKPQTQFIFATHNANFPVLGDAEQVFSCQYADDKMDINIGSIDCPTLQQEIVKIMEGGEDAFNRRKEIYQIWKL